MLTLAISGPAVASGTGDHDHQDAGDTGQESTAGHHQHKLDWGEAGSSTEVDRTIQVVMGDIYFEPMSIQAGEGETIRFVLSNTGKLIHEFNIGTNHMHKEHQVEMSKMMEQGLITANAINHDGMAHGDMKHDDANSVLLEPGKSAELVWRFTQAKKLEFACNVPGHYEAGMVGTISIEKPDSQALQ